MAWLCCTMPVTSCKSWSASTTPTEGRSWGLPLFVLRSRPKHAVVPRSRRYDCEFPSLTIQRALQPFPARPRPDALAPWRSRCEIYSHTTSIRDAAIQLKGILSANLTERDRLTLHLATGGFGLFDLRLAKRIAIQLRFSSKFQLQRVRHGAVRLPLAAERGTVNWLRTIH